jgi:hypothetical protein
MSIPKPKLKDVDETSLTLSWEGLNLMPTDKIKIEYKLPQNSWEQAKCYEVENDSGNSVDVNISSLGNLEPGTAYAIRFIVLKNGTEKLIGPETVFDTKPINCTPKKKTCSIS